MVKLSYCPVIVVAVMGCGGGPKGGPHGTGATTSMMVTAEQGGSVEIEGTTLDVPPGAVPGDTVITITSSMTSPPGFTSWNSPVYKFDPDGLVFLVPVKVTLSLTGSPSRPAIFWSRPGGGFDDLGGTAASGQISTFVMHFSEGFAAPSSGIDSGVAMQPADAPADSPQAPGSDSGVTPPHDSGVPTGDGGGGMTVDAGMLVDAGGMSVDGGVTPPSDGGTSGNDGGVIMVDSGVVMVDGSITPPSDGGMTPPSDGGMTPPSDGGMTPPSDGGGAPTVDAGAPQPDAAGPAPTPP